MPSAPIELVHKVKEIPERLAAIVDVINLYGLTPPEGIPTDPVIEADAIHLVTWMAPIPPPK